MALDMAATTVEQLYHKMDEFSSVNTTSKCYWSEKVKEVLDCL